MEKIHGFQVIFFSIPIRIVLCQMQPEAQKRNIMNVGVLSTYKYHVPNHFVKILKQLLTLQNWHAEVLMNQITYLGPDCLESPILKITGQIYLVI